MADEEGMDSVTLAAVARRLDVQGPTLYSHIRDHAALLDGITALALSDLADRIAQAIAGRAGAAALEGLAEAHRSFARESPGRWQSLQRRAGSAVSESPAARMLATLTDAVLLGYDVPADEHVHAIRLIGSTINGFLFLERIGSFDYREPSPEVSWKKSVTVLNALLLAWPTSSQEKDGTRHDQN